MLLVFKVCYVCDASVVPDPDFGLIVLLTSHVVSISFSKTYLHPRFCHVLTGRSLGSSTPFHVKRP